MIQQQQAKPKPKNSREANFQQSQVSSREQAFQESQIQDPTMGFGQNFSNINSMPQPANMGDAARQFGEALKGLGAGAAHGATFGLSDHVLGEVPNTPAGDVGVGVGSMLPLGEGTKLVYQGVQKAGEAAKAMGPAMEVASPFIDLAARWIGGPVGIAHGVYTKFRRAKMLSEAAKAAQEAEAAKGLEEMAPSVLGGDRETFAQGMGAKKAPGISPEAAPSDMTGTGANVVSPNPPKPISEVANDFNTQMGTAQVNKQAQIAQANQPSSMGSLLSQNDPWAAKGRALGQGAFLGGFGQQPQAPLSTNVAQAKMMILAGQKTGQDMAQVRAQMAAIYDPATLQFVFAALPNRLPQ